MPLIKIATSTAARLNMSAIHSRAMTIFKAPKDAVQLVHRRDIDIYPSGIFVEMRAKDKSDRGSEWMSGALKELASSIEANCSEKEPVRIRCEMFDQTKLYKNY